MTRCFVCGQEATCRCGLKCSLCGKKGQFEERFSLGIYAGRYCSDKCWKASGYRDEGVEGFDPTYAGERLDDDF